MHRLLFSLLFLTAGCATTGPVTLSSRPAPAPRPAPAERVDAVRVLVLEAARRFGLEVPLVLGVIQVESGFNPESRSSAGAAGLMQLMPRTAAALARRLGREGASALDPEFNVQAGCLYLSLLLARFDGDLRLALAAYNAGPYRVAGWRAAGRPLPDYSSRYVEAVLAARQVFADGGAPAVAARAAQASLAPARPAQPDRKGLRALLREQQARYPDEPPPPASAPASAPASRPADDRPDEGLEGLPSTSSLP